MTRTDLKMSGKLQERLNLMRGGEGGIVAPVAEWEVRVGERWDVSCFQHGCLISKNRECLCVFHNAQIGLN